MRPFRTILVCSLLLVAGVVQGQTGSGQTVDGDEVLARVNGEPITVERFLESVGTLHESAGEREGMVQRPDPYALLQRIIDFRLVLQEAMNIGFDQLPEVTARLETAHFEMLKDGMIRNRLTGLTQGDPAEVERIYRDAVREIQVESALFETEPLAETFSDSVLAGIDFQALVERMDRQGLVIASESPTYLLAGKLQPVAAEALESLEAGQVSKPIALANGFTVIRLLDVRYPDNPEARAEAERQALASRQRAELAAYTEELRTSYSKVDGKLLESVDFDSADLEDLRVDSRVVARIEGGEPVTVAELAARLESTFFHGIDKAQRQGRVQAESTKVLDRMILERATRLEAARLGIEESPWFQRGIKARREGLIFNAFVEKAVNPSVEIEEDDLQAYFSEHGSDYSSPEMFRLESVAFDDRTAAQTAMERLREGADMGWMRANAPGRTDMESAEEIWQFTGMPLSAGSLPPEVRKAVSGASNGDVRLCAQPNGPFHVVRVTQVFPPEPLPFEQVRDDISSRVFADKQRAALENWAAELRQASEVEILVDRDRLRSLVGLESELDT